MPNHIEDWLNEWVSNRPTDESECNAKRNRLAAYVRKNYLADLRGAADAFLSEHPRLIPAEVVNRFIDNGNSVLLKLLDGKQQESISLKVFSGKDAVNNLSKTIDCFNKSLVEKKPAESLAIQFQTHVIYQFKKLAITLWLSAPLKPKPEPNKHGSETPTSLKQDNNSKQDPIGTSDKGAFGEPNGNLQNEKSAQASIPVPNCNFDLIVFRILRKKNLPDLIKEEIAENTIEIWGLLDNIAINFSDNEGKFFNYVYRIVLNLFSKGLRTIYFRKSDFNEPRFLVEKLFCPNENKYVFEFFRNKIPVKPLDELNELKVLLEAIQATFPDKEYFLLAEAQKKTKYKLCFMLIDKIDDLVPKGCNLVIVALIAGTTIHIRIFDINGTYVDKPENELVGCDMLNALKNRLLSFPAHSSLSTEQQQEIIKDVAVLIGNPGIPRINELIDKLDYLKTKLCQLFNQCFLTNLEDIKDVTDAEGNPLEDKPLYDETIFDNSNLCAETHNKLKQYFSRKMEHPKKDLLLLTRLILDDIFTPYVDKLELKSLAQTESVDEQDEEHDQSRVHSIEDTTDYSTPDDYISLEQLDKKIKEAIVVLTELRKRMWEMRYECETSIKDIATQEKKARGTIRKRLFDLHTHLVFNLINLEIKKLLSEKGKTSINEIACKCKVTLADVESIGRNLRLIRKLNALVLKRRRRIRHPPVGLVMGEMGINKDQASCLIAFDIHHTLSKVVRSIFVGTIGIVVIDQVLRLQKPYLRAVKNLIPLIHWKGGVPNRADLETELKSRLALAAMQAHLISTMYWMNQTRQANRTKYSALVTSYRKEKKYPTIHHIAINLKVGTMSAEILLEWYRHAENLAKDALECLQLVTAGHASILPRES